MRPMLMIFLVFMTGCVSPYVETKEIAEFSRETVVPGSSVKAGGQSIDLEKADIDLQKVLPAVSLVDVKWQDYRFASDGRVKIISIVPSIDTKVCEQQTHLLSETEAADPKIQRVTISRDLPAAQQRFALESGMDNVQFLSDYKAGAFGKASGLLMKESGLLARAVLVVDKNGQVRYLQIVPDITKLPDISRAIEVANSLVEAK